MEDRSFDRLKLDYEQTVGMIKTLIDVRFKLLALVPTVSALGVVVSKGLSVGDACGISVVGAVATVGILLYDLRNSQLYGAAMHRAKELEKWIGFQRSNVASPVTFADARAKWWRGGLYSERPGTFRLALLHAKHDRGDDDTRVAAARTGPLHRRTHVVPGRRVRSSRRQAGRATPASRALAGSDWRHEADD